MYKRSLKISKEKSEVFNRRWTDNDQKTKVNKTNNDLQNK